MSGTTQTNAYDAVATPTAAETVPSTAPPAYKYEYKSGGLFYCWIAFIISLITLSLSCFPLTAVQSVIGTLAMGFSLYILYFGEKRHSTKTYMYMMLAFFIAVPCLLLVSVASIMLYLAAPDLVVGDKYDTKFWGVGGYNQDTLKMLLVMTACVAQVTYFPCLFFAQKHYFEVRKKYKIECENKQLSAKL